MKRPLSISYPSGHLLDAFLWNDSGQIWNGSGVETPTVTRASAYPVGLTEQPSFPGRYDAAMPSGVFSGFWTYDVIQRSGTGFSVADYPANVIGNGSVNWNGTQDLCLVDPLGSGALDNILLESGVNIRQGASVTLAGVAGLVSGAAPSGGVVDIYGANGGPLRIQANTDQNGNRLTITLHLPS